MRKEYAIPTGCKDAPTIIVQRRADGRFDFGLLGVHEPGARMMMSASLGFTPDPTDTARAAFIEGVRLAGILGRVRKSDSDAFNPFFASIDFASDFPPTEQPT
jgi:hypothetical protein